MDIIGTDSLTNMDKQDAVFRHFSKALLATLYRTYADDIEQWTSEDDFKKTASYFHFFKAAITTDPEL